MKVKKTVYDAATGEYKEIYEEELPPREESEIAHERTLEEKVQELQDAVLNLQNALITSKISGGGITTITDSSDNRIKDFKLFGKSEQVTTTGANLIPFPYTNKDMSKNGVTFEVQQDGGVKIYGTATETVDFFLSMLDYGNDSIFNNSTGNGKILSGGKDGVAIEYHGTNKRLYLTIAKGKTVNTVIYPQLQNGSTATPYEPYTGGKPSPSPEYPQEIKSVGKWNEEKQKYEVDVIRSGRNTFDVNNYVNSVKKISESEFRVENMWGTTIGEINLKAGREYRCSFTFEIDDVTNSDCGVRVKCTNKSGNVKYVFNLPRMSGYVCTSTNVAIIPSDTIKCELVLYTDVGRKKGGIFKDLIIAEENKNALLNIYEPYRNSQTLTLTSDRPITKWDKLVEQDGQIGWLYNTEKYIVTGNEDFETLKSYNVERSIDYSFNNIKQIGSRKTGENFCNSLTYVDAVWGKTDVGFGIGGNEVHIRLAYETIGSNKDEDDSIKKKKFIDYLTQRYDNGDPIIFYHKSKATEFVPLSQSEQNAIRALKTYYPTTVITADGGEVDPDIEVSYIADTKNYIDQKIAAIGKTVVATQKALL